MSYVTTEEILQARQMDLLTYLRNYEAEAKRRNDARRQVPLKKRQQRDYER